MKKRSNGFAAIVVVLTAISAAWGLWIWAGNPVGSGRTKRVVVVVKPGMGARAVGALLQRKGLIRSQWHWRWLVARGGVPKPGTYAVAATERPESMLRRMVAGATATVNVTFPEGFTVVQIADRLARRRIIQDPESFVNVAKTRGAELFPQLGGSPNLEGFLFPDTYAISVDANDEQILRQMVANFERRWAEALEETGVRPDLSQPEIVVIASLIERETRTPKDRPLVAGVIRNRLAAGQKLEIDATVQYARGQHKKRLFYKDLEVDSPYNTYRNAGLPPGAICNPGYAALLAALKPARHDFFYYVLGRDRRNHEFSKTFEEHKRRIAEIRRR